MLSRKIFLKALARPILFLGVPIAPLVLSFLVCIILCLYTNMLYIIFYTPVFLTLRILTNIDEQIFSILGTKRYLMMDKIRAKQIKFKLNAFYYSAIDYQNRNVAKNSLEGITVIDVQKAIKLKVAIPYSTQVDESIICDRNGNLITTWVIEGVSYQLRDDENIDAYNQKINNFLLSLQGDNISFYTNIVRLNSSHIKKNDISHNKFANEINNLYLSSFQDINFMENNIYVTVIYKESNSLKLSKKTMNEAEKLSVFQERLVNFKEKLNQIESSLDTFGANKLRCYEKDNIEGLFSEQLEFYNFLLSFEWQPIRVLNKPIYEYLGSSELSTTNGLIKILQNNNTKYAKCIEIKDWVSYTEAGLLDVLNDLPIKYILTQSFSSMSKAKALKTLKEKGRQLKSVEDEAQQQRLAIEEAKEIITDAGYCIGDYHFSLFVYSDSEEELNKSINELMVTMSDVGFVTVPNRLASDEAYFAQLPANFQFRQRVIDITSSNFSDLNSLHNNPVGKSSNNAWGDAVTILKTTSNQGFYFNFHQVKQGRNDFGDMVLAHTLLIGKSGTGKTMLLDFLMTQLMKFNDVNTFPVQSEIKKMTTFFFDKDYGAKIAIKALGGEYNELKLGEQTNFNPFLIEDTKENIVFLNTLIKMLAFSDDEKISVANETKIELAIKAVMSFEPKDRAYPISLLLQNIQDEHDDDSSLYKRLEKWTNGKSNGWVFDNKYDCLDFEKNSLFGFDGTEVLGQKNIVSPLTYYLLYKINLIMDGRRLPIFMDEFWLWLKSKSIEPFIFDGLKTNRKKNSFFVFATQSPDEILNSDIARAIIEQTETFIFLPNSKADYEQYTKGFQVSEKEYGIIRSLADDSRAFLIKKAENQSDKRGNSVLAKLDLSKLGRGNLNILSSSKDNILIMENIINEVGNDPDKWVEIFRNKCV